VTIEQLRHGEFIRRYDRTGMLRYLDPPYWGCEKDYGKDVFFRGDFDQLAAQIAGIKGSSCCRSTMRLACARRSQRST